MVAVNLKGLVPPPRSKVDFYRNVFDTSNIRMGHCSAEKDLNL